MAKTKAPVTKLGAKHMIGYGAGDAGGVCMLMVISYLERFSRNILGINPAVYAAILIVWNVWDAINDPLVGTFMDFAFSKAKPGSDKFRPWILRSIPILAIGMGSLMTLPTMFEGLLCIVVLFISKIVFELGYTIMNIGMGSLLGVMATNDAERASLSSARGFGSTVGGMVGMMVLPQILAKKFDLVAIIRTCILVGCIMLGGCFVYAVMAEAMIPVLYIAWSGIGTGLVTLSVQLQWGLVGESIDYNEYLTGKRSEGSIYGVFSLTRRIGQTLSGSLAVLMITWFGYQAGASVQPASAILGIKMMVILIPAVIGMGSWAAFRFIWDINAEKRAKMAAWKAERAAKAAQE